MPTTSHWLTARQLFSVSLQKPSTPGPQYILSPNSDRWFPWLSLEVKRQGQQNNTTHCIRVSTECHCVCSFITGQGPWPVAWGHFFSQSLNVPFQWFPLQKGGACQASCPVPQHSSLSVTLIFVWLSVTEYLHSLSSEPDPPDEFCILALHFGRLEHEWHG